MAILQRLIYFPKYVSQDRSSLSPTGTVGDTGCRQQLEDATESHAHRIKAGFFFVCVNLIIQIFIYTVRKTSSSSPRHHEAPPDSITVQVGGTAGCPPHSPKETRGRGQAEKHSVCTCKPAYSLVLSCWKLMPTAHLGHQPSW